MLMHRIHPPPTPKLRYSWDSYSFNSYMYSIVHMTADAHKNDSAMHKDTDAQAISAEIVLTLF